MGAIDEWVKDTLIEEAANEGLISFATVNGGTGNDILNGTTDEFTRYVYTHTSGNDTITNYKGWEEVQFNDTYQGWYIDGNDFIVTGDNGSVRFHEVRGKVINLTDGSGNVLLRGLMQNYSGTFDASEIEGPFVGIGVNRAENYLIASNSGSTLWGGLESNDILNGGTGRDRFIYNYDNGNDYIFDASTEDIVDLSNMSWGNVRGVYVDKDRTTFTFNNFQTLEIEGNPGVYLFSDGAFYYDKNNRSFQQTTVTSGIGDLFFVNSDSYVVSGTQFFDGFVFENGNTTINNFQNREEIIMDANFTGWDTAGNDFVFYAEEGSVRVTEARDKVINLVDVNGDNIMHAIMQSGEGTFNGSDYDGYLVAYGGDNASNIISAGDGGSILWGGIGGNDVLSGGKGVDYFRYDYGDGNDVVTTVGEEDVLDLSRLNLDNIGSITIDKYRSIFSFKDYGTLDVEGRVGAVMIGDETYTFNYDNKTMNRVSSN